MMDHKIYRLIDTNSDGTVATRYWISEGTAKVMQGRLEGAGALGVDIEPLVIQARMGDGSWEPSPFDVQGWLEKWTRKGPPTVEAPTSGRMPNANSAFEQFRANKK